MSAINPSVFSDATINPLYEPYNANITAEQPWVDTKFSLYDSDIEVRSADGFIFQLHRVLLGATTGSFPGSEMETGGELVHLSEPAEVLAILFAFLYPKPHPDLHGMSFDVLSAVAEASGKYEVFSATDICNERLVKFLPQHAPKILVHAVKHNYPRLISETLPHFARAPFLPVLEKLSPPYMLPWARYHEAWKSVFKDLAFYIKNLKVTSANCSGSSYAPSHNTNSGTCITCAHSLAVLLIHLEEIDTISTLRDTLMSPTTQYLQSTLKCCRHANAYDSKQPKPLCPFVNDMTKLCQEKIEKIPSFSTFLGLKA